MRIIATIVFSIAFCQFQYLEAGSTKPSPFGLSPDIPLTELVLNQWSTDDGLISNNLTSIRQTVDGFIWTSSFNGLQRFDGNNFILFDKDNVNQLLSNAFYRINEDNAGNLWCATQGSYLLKYSDGEFSTIGVKSGLPNSIRDVIVDQRGWIWAGANSKGCYVKKDTLFELCDIPVLQNISIYDIEEAPDGSIWISTFGNGLVKYTPNGTYEVFNEKNGLLDNVVTSVTVTDDNTVYAGTIFGLNIIRDNKVTAENSTKGFAINSILLDSFGSIWLAMEEGACRISKNGNTELLTEENGLPSKQISDICLDHEGSIWLSTKKSGILRIKKGSFFTLSKKDGLASNNTNIIHEKNGNYYIGSDEGKINVYSQGKLSELHFKTSLEGKGIRDIYVDDNGTIWAASYLGLLKINKKEELLFNKQDGFVSKEIRRVFSDGTDFLWLATRSGGVIKFNKYTHKTIVYNKMNGLKSNYILSIAQDSKGNKFFGTHGGGLTMLSPDGGCKNFDIIEDSSGILIFNIRFDKHGVCWLATNIGAFIFQNGKFTKIVFDKKFKTETFFDAVIDNANNLWLTSNNGILQIKVDEINKFLKGEQGFVNVKKMFDQSDGMINKECTGATRCTLAHDGRIWVPTLGGVAVIDPNMIMENPIPPKVYITSFTTNAGTSNTNQHLYVNPGNTRYILKFTSLSYYAPDKNEFMYRLENFDNDWITDAHERIAHYTNLKPGTYTLYVKGSNNDGIWNAKPATFTFTVLPYFYQTVWFKVLLGLIIILFLLLIYRTRVHSVELRNNELKKLNAELDRFVYSASHDLRAPLASVLGLVDLAEKETTNAMMYKYLKMIETTVKKLDAFTREITDYSRNARQELDIRLVHVDQLVTNTIDSLKFLDKDNKIEITVNITGDYELYSDPRRISVILHNLISNSYIYHLPQRPNPFIKIQVSKEYNRTIFKIIDNGKGIREEHLNYIFKMFYRASEGNNGSGLGLYIVKETVDKLRGRVTVDSKYGEGTAFTVIIPTMRNGLFMHKSKLSLLKLRYFDKF